MLNNSAFQFGISVPLQLILRSSSVVWTMIIGKIFFKKSYRVGQFVCGLMIAIGTSLISAFDLVKLENLEMDWNKSKGIGMILISLILSSFLGHVQELGFSKYNISWKGKKKIQFFQKNLKF